MVWRYSSTGGWCSTGTEWARATEDSGTDEPPSSTNHCVRHRGRESTGRRRGPDVAPGLSGPGHARRTRAPGTSVRRRTVQQFLEELHTLDHPGTGTGEVRVGVDGDDPAEARRLGDGPGARAACATAPSRSNPHGMKIVMSTSAPAISSQVRRRDRAPATARTGTPPAASTWSGTQCPALNGGSCHSRTSTRGRRRPRTRCRTASTRARKVLHQRVCARARCPSPPPPSRCTQSPRRAGPGRARRPARGTRSRRALPPPRPTAPRRPGRGPAPGSDQGRWPGSGRHRACRWTPPPPPGR